MRFQTDLSSVEDHQTVNATLKRHTHARAKCIFKCVVGHDETLNFKQVKQSACRDEWSQKTPSKRVEILDNMRHNQLGASGIQSWSMSKNTSCVWSKNIPSTAVWHGLWGGGQRQPRTTTSFTTWTLLEGFKVKSSEFTKRTKTVRCISIRPRRGTFLTRWLSSGRRSTWTEKRLSLRLQHHNLYLSFTSQEQLLLKTHPWEWRHGLLNLPLENNSLTYSTKKPPDMIIK